MSANAPTLTEALKSVGLSHRACNDDGKRTIFNAETGAVLGSYFASEGWELYRRVRDEQAAA